MATPQTVDGFSRIMVPQFNDRKQIPLFTAFQAFFGNPANGGKTLFSNDSNVVDIDIIRGNELTAALVPRGTVTRPLGTLQSNMLDGKYTSISRKYPLSEEEGDISADKLLARVAGENPYEVRTRNDRMMQIGRDIADEAIRRQIRLFERLAAQSILTGIQDAILGTTNTDLQYDFLRKAANTITVGTIWSNVAAPILSDLDGAADKVRQNGKANPDMVVLGETAMNGFLGNTQVLALADNRRFELIQVNDADVPPQFERFVQAGFVPRGRLRTPAGYLMWLFTYTGGVFENPAGTFVPFIGDDAVLVTSSQARCDRYFGPPERLPPLSVDQEMFMEYFGFSPDTPAFDVERSAGGIIEPQAFHVDAYRTSDKKHVTIRSQTAPIFATTQTDAFVTLDTTP